MGPSIFECFLLLLTCHVALSLSSVSYRTGQKADEWTISTTMAKQLMNPLGIDASNFVVATDPKDNNALVGWAQIRPLGSSLTNPNQYNAPPGSYSTDQDVDDTMWLEFDEDESVQVPSGWASLPWTKEYKAFSQQAKSRRKRREQLMQEQTRQVDKESSSPLLWELASVYVRPEYRSQGIGSGLVARCLQRHVQRKRMLVNSVYLLTLGKRAPWYASGFAFEIVPDATDIPSSMQLEIAAGTIITKLIDEELCCMRATPATLACVIDRSYSTSRQPTT